MCPHQPEPPTDASDDPDTPQELALPNDASSVGTARTYVHQVITGWGATPLPNLGLLTSEVVTNAVVHTNGRIKIAVRHLGTHARVEVHDVEPAPPELLREHDARRLGGWGMQFVDSLAACWGVRNIEDDGKIVWFDTELMPPRLTPPEG